MDDEDDYVPHVSVKAEPKVEPATKKAKLSITGFTEVFSSVAALFYGTMEKENLLRAMLIAYPCTVFRSIPQNLDRLSLTFVYLVTAMELLFFRMAPTFLQPLMSFAAPNGMKFCHRI
jgi:hypothetical protein